jgi:hypothetical protein
MPPAEVSRALLSLTARGARLHYTSQNLGEFWNVSTRSQQQNGFGLSPAEAETRAQLIEMSSRLFPMGQRSTGYGDDCWLRFRSQECRCMMLVLWLPCWCTM